MPSLHWQGQQNGIHYIVQEYIDGQNLEQELKESGPFSEEKILQVLEELLPLLARIHSVEVIHRDIKPENIIRRRNDRRLVLVDFGAVKVATPTAMAKTGTKIGSAEYAAPEQTRGRAVFASDLYGLGATCVHLLTGRSPWDLRDDLEGRWIWRELLPPGVRVSQRLGQVLDRLVSEPLKGRFQTAQEALTALHPPASPPPEPGSQPPQQPSHDSPSQQPNAQQINSHHQRVTERTPEESLLELFKAWGIEIKPLGWREKQGKRI
ncbi:MAG: protein kinase domain-containing protein [Prochlorothrix sp.]